MCDVNVNSSSKYDGDWHFIVGVFENGSTTTQYFDGVSFKNTGTYSTSSSDVGIAHDFHNNYKLEGDLAYVRIYSSALGKEQVQQLYKYGRNVLDNL